MKAPLASNPLNSASNKHLPDLIGKWSSLDLPDTMEMGDHGEATLKVRNRGKVDAQGPITINLYLSTDGKIDKNDILLKTVNQDINLQAGQSMMVNFDYDNITSAIASGAYCLIAEIDGNQQMAEKREDNNIVSKRVSAPNTDVVLDWLAIACNAIQAEGEAGRGIPPTLGSRLLAMLSTAIYDTVNAFERTHQPYEVDAIAPTNASLQAAVAGAAHYLLTALIPEQAQMLQKQLKRSLREIKDKPTEETIGVDFGSSIAQQILASRANDGSDNNAPYVPPAGDYVWKPETDPSKPNFGVAVGANWGHVTPFAIANVEQFAPDGLDGIPGTQLFLDEIAQVRSLGEKNSSTRTAEQTEIAIFWASDRADTFRPYGHLNQLAEIVAVNEGNTIAENARLFAALNVAIADAAIVAWEAKYDNNNIQPRPDDVINGGIGGIIPDPDWQPLLAPTPPFPDYISGHSSFGGAFAGVMNYFFGEDYVFTGVSQELPGVTRSLTFNQAAFEDAISRVYGGVHVLEATVTDAVPMGLAVGNYVAENFFQPIVM